MDEAKTLGSFSNFPDVQRTRYVGQCGLVSVISSKSTPKHSENESNGKKGKGEL